MFCDGSGAYLDLGVLFGDHKLVLQHGILRISRARKREKLPEILKRVDTYLEIPISLVLIACDHVLVRPTCGRTRVSGCQRSDVHTCGLYRLRCLIEFNNSAIWSPRVPLGLSTPKDPGFADVPLEPDMRGRAGGRLGRHSHECNLMGLTSAFLRAFFLV